MGNSSLFSGTVVWLWNSPLAAKGWDISCNTGAGKSVLAVCDTIRGTEGGRTPGPDPLLAQNCVQVVFECLQGWKASNSSSEQPELFTHKEKVFSDVPGKFLCPVCSSFLQAWAHWAEPGPVPLPLPAVSPGMDETLEPPHSPSSPSPSPQEPFPSFHPLCAIPGMLWDVQVPLH